MDNGLTELKYEETLYGRNKIGHFNLLSDQDVHVNLGYTFHTFVFMNLEMIIITECTKSYETNRRNTTYLICYKILFLLLFCLSYFLNSFN